MAQVILVDTSDEVIGAQERSLLLDTDIYRVTGLWLENSQGEILLARRSKTKRYDPDRWSIAVAGTVEVRETYLSNILKETQEELGLVLSRDQLTEVLYTSVESEHFFWYKLFRAVVDVAVDELVLQPEEVDAVRFISLYDLQREYDQYPERFTRSFGRTLHMVYPEPNKKEYKK